MKDPYIHAEKTILGIGYVKLNQAFQEVTGVNAEYYPKTVGTGCGKRRPFAMTSTIPEKITCLACREWMAAEFRMEIESAESLLQWTPDDDPTWAMSKSSPEQMREYIRETKVLLARLEMGE